MIFLFCCCFLLLLGVVQSTEVLHTCSELNSTEPFFVAVSPVSFGVLLSHPHHHHHHVKHYTSGSPDKFQCAVHLDSNQRINVLIENSGLAQECAHNFINVSMVAPDGKQEHSHNYLFCGPTAEVVDIEAVVPGSSVMIHVKISEQVPGFRITFSTKDPSSHYNEAEEQNCGSSLETSVSTGEFRWAPVPARNWPWITFLVPDTGIRCFATLINERWYITSASCLENQYDAEEWRVVEVEEGSKELPRVREIVLHHDFVDLRKPDLALIWLHDEVDEDSEPACVAHEPVDHSNYCVALAWDHDEERLVESILPKTESFDQCGDEEFGEEAEILRDSLCVLT